MSKDTSLKSFKKYIRQINNTLYNILTDVDPENLLFNNIKVKHGFTFLMPNDNYTEQLNSLYENDEEKAYEALKCLIMCQYLKSTNDWSINRDDISNLHSKKVEIDNVSQKQIVLKCKDSDNPAILQLDRQFNSESIAIFNVVSGFVPKGSIKSKVKVLNKTKPNNTPNNGSRSKLLNEIINSRKTYIDCLNYVSSFFHYMSKNNMTVLQSIVPYLDYCPVTTFIILFEPTKGSYYFIDDSIIDSWFPTFTPLRNAKDIFVKVLESVKDMNSSAYLTSDSFRDEVQNIRSDIQSELSPRNMVLNIRNIYNRLINENTIESSEEIINNVYPKASYEYMKARCNSNHNIKLNQDEIRVDISQSREGGLPWDEILEGVLSSLKLYPVIVDSNAVEASSKKAYLISIGCFINTTYFLYMLPYKKSQFGGTPGLYNDVNPAADVDDLIDLVIDPVPYKVDLVKSIVTTKINIDDIILGMQELLDSGDPIDKGLIDVAKRLVDECIV